MGIRDFKDLIVWTKAHALVLDIYTSSEEFSMSEEFGLRMQIRRSAVSVCVNIAEGYRKSTRDYIRYLEISLGSLEETKYHLILSRDRVFVIGKV